MKPFNPMPSTSASSKFILSVLKFLRILKFLGYTQKYSNEPIYVEKSNFLVYQNDFEYT